MRTELAEFFLMLGLLISFIASIGLLRFPDLLCRMHALGKVTTLGLSCVLLGLGIAFFKLEVVLKLLLVFFIIFLLAPLSGHLLARALFRYGVKQEDNSY